MAKKAASPKSGRTPKSDSPSKTRPAARPAEPSAQAAARPGDSDTPEPGTTKKAGRKPAATSETTTPRTRAPRATSPRRGKDKSASEPPAAETMANVEPQAGSPIPRVTVEPVEVTAIGGEGVVAESVQQVRSGPERRQSPAGTRQDVDGERLSILMVASEAMPFAKSGGLADVAGALPLALARLGHSVTLVMPRYRGIDASGAPSAQLTIDMGRVSIETRFFERALADRARVVFVDCPELFDREHLYGEGRQEYPDNAGRFAFLSRAALEYAAHAGLQPDIIHAHDWQTGLVPVYRRTHYAEHPAFENAATVFTVHNVAYQGLYSSDWLPELGLSWDLYSIEALEYWLHISFLKGGIVFSDKISTVSPTYARQILAPGAGFGFEGLLHARQDDLTGILNGIDTAAWDPARDGQLPARYDARDLSGKRECKRALLEHYGLAAGDDALRRPVVAMISRMIDQKGHELISALAGDLPDFGAAFVVMGEGEPRYREMWQRLAGDYPDRFAVEPGYDETRAHLIQAGADILLMPSRFEPCGLSQMYSQRYGTVPVVHATGGLVDTVEPFDPSTGKGTGFVFDRYTPEGLGRALRSAIEVFGHETQWRRLQVNGMAKDFSWPTSAQQYVRLYQEARQATGRRALATAGR
jgi:starch synthase